MSETELSFLLFFAEKRRGAKIQISCHTLLFNDFTDFLMMMSGFILILK